MFAVPVVVRREKFVMRKCGLLLLVGFLPWLGGCGTGATTVLPVNTVAANCVGQAGVQPGAVSGTANFNMSAGNTITLYPGQTASLPVAVSSAQVAAGAPVNFAVQGLPSGLNITAATGAVGSTANIVFQSTPALASECFTAAAIGDAVNVVIGLTATGPGGTLTTGLNLQVVLENPSFVPSKLALPSIDIETAGQAPVDSKDVYVQASMALQDASDTSQNYEGQIEIKGHGNSTWLMPKKPYHIKLSQKASLLEMPQEKDWILLANYDDKTMLRDAVASELSNRIGLPWAPRSQFVELTLNGQYEGTYQLIESVDIDSNRINIASSSSTSSKPQQDGFLLEIDQREEATFHWLTPHGLYVETQDPDPPSAAGETYIQNGVNAAEASMYAANFTNQLVGWRSQWDESSVIDWFLTNELMGNVDSIAVASDYFYKDAGALPFVMGPIWDFDISAGNTNYTAIVSPGVPWLRTLHPWYAQLFTDPTFEADVKTRWRQVRPQVVTISSYIDTQAALLNQAEQNNFARWPTLYQKVWPNAEAAGTYQGEIQYLESWLSQRIAYMDATYGN